jgi:hypothetical protein
MTARKTSDPRLATYTREAETGPWQENELSRVNMFSSHNNARGQQPVVHWLTVREAHG